jgi:tetratricopeptide (TPR) repeat protein
MKMRLGLFGDSKFLSFAFASLPCLIVFLFYLPILNNGFIDWDDREMITNNPHIYSLGLSSIGWMFTTNTGGLWIPLTFFSFALNYLISGLNPMVFHLTNLIFHLLNTYLVFLVSKKLLDYAAKSRSSGKGHFVQPLVLPTAFLASLLFGLHPIHVESVAWAAERKDVLYSFFYLLSINIYLSVPFFDVFSSDGKKKKISKNKKFLGDFRSTNIFLLLALYLFALMAKPMAITLPLIFLILDFWPLNRHQNGLFRIIQEKIPFFLVALLVSLVTRLGMGDVNRINKSLSLFTRVAHVFHSLVFYLWKMIVPIKLVPVYPFPLIFDSFYYLKAVVAALLIIIISLFVFYYRNKYPFFVLGWSYYIITLLPVLGFVQVGSFAAGDRYTYLSCLGIFIPFSAGLAVLLAGRRNLFWFFCSVLCLSLGCSTMKQIVVWKDQDSVQACVSKAFPVETWDNEMRYGDELLKFGKAEDSLKHFRTAAAIPPFRAAPHERIGSAYMANSQFNGAIVEFKEALNINKNTKEYPSSFLHNELWDVYMKEGKQKEAFADAQRLLIENPKDPSAYYEMGIVQSEEKHYLEAEFSLKAAVQLNTNKRYLDTLASLYLKTGKSEQAIQVYKRGIQIDSQDPVPYLRLANIYLDRKEISQALVMLNTALNLNGTNSQFFQELGTCFERAGEKGMASKCYERAQNH